MRHERQLTATAVQAGARLDRLPATHFHRRVVWIVGLSIFFDFFDAAMAGALVGGFLSSHWSTLRQNTLFLAATGVGGVVGNVAAGWFADHRGRRAALRTALALVGITTLASAAAASMTLITVLRFISMVGISAIPTIGFSTLAELMPPEARGRWNSLGGALANSATVCAALAGYILIPAGAWRFMFVIPGVACLVLWLAARRIPESPRWLEAVGRAAEAESTMDDIEREVATALHGALPPIGAVHASRSAPTEVTAPPEVTDSLWRRQWARRLILAICIALGANAAVSTVLTWLPTILLTQGLTLSNTLERTLLMTTGAPIGALLGALFADRLGRRRGIASIAVIAAALAALFSVSSSGVLSIVLGFALLTALAFLANVVYAVYLPELFPTTLRVQGAAAAAAATKFVFIFLPFAMASLLAQGGTVAAMGLIEGCLSLVAVSTLLFGAETAYKPLEVASSDSPVHGGSRSELAH